MFPALVAAGPILAIGDRVSPGVYSLHSTFDSVRNFVRSECLVSIVAPEVGRSGYNILWDVSKSELPTQPSIEIVANGVFVGGELFSTAQAQVFCSQWSCGCNCKWPRSVLPTLRGLLEFSQFGFVLNSDPDFSGLNGFELSVAMAARRATQNFAAGSIESGVRGMRGLGVGLTPGGDDFLTGMLAAHSVLEKIDGVCRRDTKMTILECALGGNALSNAFLRAAGEGSFSERQKVFFEACIRGTETEMLSAAKDIIAIGATSGADFAVGFLYTMERECVA
jgi:hypothetical protein